VTVEQVLALARDLGIDYDIHFAPDATAIRQLDRIQVNVLEAVIQMAPWGYEIPGSERTPIDVSVYAAGYDLPDDFWRARAARAEHPLHSMRTPVQLVHPSHLATVPHVHPSAYIEEAKLHPIDGVTDGDVDNRRFGWQGIETVQLLWMPEPEPLEDVADELALNNDAMQALAYQLVNFFAKRALTATSVTQQAREDAGASLQALYFAVRHYPGQRAYGAE
jgi:hypothetical protein